MTKLIYTQLDHPILTLKSPTCDQADFYRTNDGILYLSATKGQVYRTLSEAIDNEVGLSNEEVNLKSEAIPQASLKRLASHLLAPGAKPEAMINGEIHSVRKKVVH